LRPSSASSGSIGWRGSFGEIDQHRLGDQVKRGVRIILVLVVLAVGVLVWFAAYTYVKYPKQFTTSTWRAQPGKRVSMADELVGSKTLIGLSSEKATRLLGKPADRQEVDKFFSFGAFSGGKPTTERIAKRARQYFGLSAKASLPSAVEYYSLGRTLYGLGRQRARLLVGYRNDRVVAATVKAE